MGGDLAPGMVVSGALRAATDSGVRCTLVGDETAINPLLTGAFSRNGTLKEIDLVHAPQVVNMSDFPTQIIRKKQSSMALAYALRFRPVGEGEVSIGPVKARENVRPAERTRNL